VSDPSEGPGPVRRAQTILSQRGARGLAERALLRMVSPRPPKSPDLKGPLMPLAGSGDDGGLPAPRVAAVFVAFFPDDRFAHRVTTASEQVDRVYIVDNTPAGPADHLPSGPPVGEQPSGPAGDQLPARPDVEVIRNGRNLGVATALNQGARRALAQGYDFLLMMDQDSSPRDGMVAALQRAFRQWPTRVAIASPLHLDPNSPPGPDSAGERGQARSMLVTMTAGSLLDLQAYRELGPFRDDLFIDQVDHEYCLRAHRNGYDVVQVGNAVIEHTLGDRTVRNVGGRAVVTSNHSALRRYYITRNRLIVAREYPDIPSFRRLQRWQTLSELRDIVLFEDRRKAKLTMMVRGARDYARHRTGPLPESQKGA
jgi:rhamnosyltransferase